MSYQLPTPFLFPRRAFDPRMGWRMAYIPDRADWFHAEVVVEHRVEDDPRNVVHINLILIKAATADEAYEKAMTMGAEAESEYLNPAGKQVQTVFVGIASLGAVHDSLEDGVEIRYEELVDVSTQELSSMVKQKHELGAFRTITPSPDRPDYSSGEIVDELIKRAPLDAENALARAKLRIVDSDHDESPEEDL